MIGRCQYLTCESMIGSEFRSGFYRRDGGFSDTREVMLCPTHTRLFEEIRAKHGWSQFLVTEEGWVYLRYWMDSMGFVA